MSVVNTTITPCYPSFSSLLFPTFSFGFFHIRLSQWSHFKELEINPPFISLIQKTLSNHISQCVLVFSLNKPTSQSVCWSHWFLSVHPSVCPSTIPINDTSLGVTTLRHKDTEPNQSYFVRTMSNQT